MPIRSSNARRVGPAVLLFTLIAPALPAAEAENPTPAGDPGLVRCIEAMTAAKPDTIAPTFAVQCAPVLPDAECRAAFHTLAAPGGAAALDALTASCQSALAPAVRDGFIAWRDTRGAELLSRPARFPDVMADLTEIARRAGPGDLVTLLGLVLVQPIEVKGPPIALPPSSARPSAHLLLDVGVDGRVALSITGASFPCGGQAVCPDDAALAAAAAAFVAAHPKSATAAFLRVHSSVPFERVIAVMDRIRGALPDVVFDTTPAPPAPAAPAPASP